MRYNSTFIASLDWHVERCCRWFNITETVSPAPKSCQTSVRKIINAYEVSDGRSVETKVVHPRLFKPGRKWSQRQELPPIATIAYRLGGSIDLFRQSTCSLNTTVKQTFVGSGNFRYHLGQIGRIQVANFETDFRNIVASKMGCIKFQSIDLGTFRELDQAPIVPGLSSAPAFPTIQNFSLFAKCIRVEDRRAIIEQGFGDCKPIICGKKNLCTAHGTRQIRVVSGERATGSYILARLSGFQVKIDNACCTDRVSSQMIDARVDLRILSSRLNVGFDSSHV
mmetsp:Transcript_4334/g.10466  ORF Transcript_4334/g.10466 Transcript_4334/m.10466 type:complete len:281 (-) Transcript_4334:109-951(-)